MRNLLSADFARLRRSRIFWLLEAGMFAWGVFVYYMMKINIGNGRQERGHMYFFHEMSFIGITIACFAAFFIGTEYSDGTMRNKLAVGHSRKNVYLAKLITVLLAGFAQFASYTLAALTVGTAFVGNKAWNELYMPVESFVLAFLSIGASAAVAVLISMIIIDKPKAVLANILISLLLLVAGVSALKGLLQPEMTRRLYIPERDEYVYHSEESLTDDTIYLAEDVPNPKYLRGTERKIYSGISMVIPVSQALLCAMGETEYDRFSAMTVVSACLSMAVLSCGGIFIFTRRDIR